MPIERKYGNTETTMSIPLTYRKLYVGEAFCVGDCYDIAGRGVSWETLKPSDWLIGQVMKESNYVFITQRPDPFKPKRKSCV